MKKSDRYPEATFLIFIFIVFVFLATVALAEDRYGVFFINQDGSRMPVAELSIVKLGSDDGYRLQLDEDRFADYFLSMRPFKCITRGKRMLCHLPYPYANRRNISRDDLTDLEYDLLFIERSPTEYGIDPWNGRYFRLRWDGDAILGEIHEVDLDELAVPPEQGDFRPLNAADLTPAETSPTRWMPTLRIEALD
jgi:hypothetical protein